MKAHQICCPCAQQAEVDELEKQLAAAKAALTAMLALRGGMEKPGEHPQTRDALRKAEIVLYGYSNL
jgi:hypothetical protein